MQQGDLLVAALDGSDHRRTTIRAGWQMFAAGERLILVEMSAKPALLVEVDISEPLDPRSCASAS